jgi:hypothetical protein
MACPYTEQPEERGHTDVWAVFHVIQHIQVFLRDMLHKFTMDIYITRIKRDGYGYYIVWTKIGWKQPYPPQGTLAEKWRTILSSVTLWQYTYITN